MEKNYYQFNITNIVKDKNILTITLDDNEVITYDFIKNLYTIDERRRIELSWDKNRKLDFKKTDNVNDLMYYVVVSCLEQAYSTSRNWTDVYWYSSIKIINDELISYGKRVNLKDFEKYFSYLDLIDFKDFFNERLEIPEIEKGYIPFLRKNNYKMNVVSYIKFYLLNHGFSEKKIERISAVIGDKIFENSFLFSNCNNEIFNFLYYPIIKSGKELGYCDDLLNDIFDLYSLIKDYGFNYVNKNRDIKQNLEIYLQIDENSKKEKITENQRRLEFLEEMIDSPIYKIVIPYTVEDLIDEGNQQNNCVGSYYNDDIANGDDLIYFIRKKDNPEKSLVTCRYNVYDEETIEYKLKNNKDADEYEKDIEKIDEIIRQYLE